MNATRKNCKLLKCPTATPNAFAKAGHNDTHGDVV